MTITPKERMFAYITPVHVSFLNCKRISFHTLESADSIEVLSVRVAALYKKITRLEIYLVTGKAPELLDKDLEQLRAEGYLEYEFPFDQELMKKNIVELQSELSDKLVLKEEIERLAQRKDIKQYYLTKKGEKLAKTEQKDSMLEGDLRFILLRNGSWISIGSELKENPHRRYTRLSEDDYGFIETFLKEFKDRLSKVKIFKELTLNSELGIYEPSDPLLWTIYPQQQIYLYFNGIFLEINTDNQVLLPIDEFTLKEYLVKKKTPLHQITSDIPSKASKEVYLGIYIDSKENLDVFREEDDIQILHDWSMDILVCEGDIAGIFRILLLPTKPEIADYLVFSYLKQVYSQGILKPRREWMEEITSHLNRIKELSNIMGNAEDVLQLIEPTDELIISENLIKAYLEKEFKTEIEHISFKESRPNEIAVYCILPDRIFREAVLRATNLRNPLVSRLNAVKGKFTQKILLNVACNNLPDLFGALLFHDIEKNVISRKKLEADISKVLNKIPRELEFLEIPTASEVMESLRNNFHLNIVIAEESVESYLEEMPLKMLLVSPNVINEGTIGVYSFIEETILPDGKYLEKDSIYSLVTELSSKMKTPEGVEFSLFWKVRSEKELEDLTIIITSHFCADKVLNMNIIEKQIIKISSELIKNSEKRYSPLNPLQIKTIFKKVREEVEVSLEEDFIKKDLIFLFGDEKNLLNLEFDYKEKVVTAIFGLSESAIGQSREDAVPFLLGQHNSRTIGNTQTSTRYKMIYYPIDEESTKKLIIFRILTLQKVNNRIWNIKDLEKRITQYLKRFKKQEEYKLEFPHSFVEECIANLREEALIIQEDLILSKASELLGEFSEFEISSNEVRIKISKKNWKKLWENLQVIFDAEMKTVQIPMIGEITFKIEALDEKAFTESFGRILQNSLYRSIDQFLNRANKLFSKLLAQSAIEESERRKVLSKQTKLVKKIQKDIKFVTK